MNNNTPLLLLSKRQGIISILVGNKSENRKFRELHFRVTFFLSGLSYIILSFVLFWLVSGKDNLAIVPFILFFSLVFLLGVNGIYIALSKIEYPVISEGSNKIEMNIYNAGTFFVLSGWYFFCFLIYLPFYILAWPIAKVLYRKNK